MQTLWLRTATDHRRRLCLPSGPDGCPESASPLADSVSMLLSFVPFESVVFGLFDDSVTFAIIASVFASSTTIFYVFLFRPTAPFSVSYLPRLFFFCFC